MIEDMREEFEDEEEMRGDEFEDLFKFSMERKWEQVVEIYKQNPKSHKTKLTNSEETALHVAIWSYNPRMGSHIEQMIDIMEGEGSLAEAVWMQNERGDTALHIAAAVGSPYICGCIASKFPQAICIRNAYGETPLFVAAHHGNLQAFLCLHHLCNPQESDLLRRTKDGDTVLHSAISGEYFSNAFSSIKWSWILGR